MNNFYLSNEVDACESWWKDMQPTTPEMAWLLRAAKHDIEKLIKTTRVLRGDPPGPPWEMSKQEQEQLDNDVARTDALLKLIKEKKEQDGE